MPGPHPAPSGPSLSKTSLPPFCRVLLSTEETGLYSVTLSSNCHSSVLRSHKGWLRGTSKHQGKSARLEWDAEVWDSPRSPLWLWHCDKNKAFRPGSNLSSSWVTWGRWPPPWALVSPCVKWTVSKCLFWRLFEGFAEILRVCGLRDVCWRGEEGDMGKSGKRKDTAMCGGQPYQKCSESVVQ